MALLQNCHLSTYTIDRKSFHSVIKFIHSDKGDLIKIIRHVLTTMCLGNTYQTLRIPLKAQYRPPYIVQEKGWS